MSADSNMGFHQGVMPSSLQNRHMLSFQLGSSNFNTVDVGSSGQIGSSAGMFFSGGSSLLNSNGITAIGAHVGPSSSTTRLDPAAGINRDSGLSPEWAIEEQHVLKQGLIKYAGEHSTMKYIKIAAMLRRKTVRDVALRCRWLAENGKRRKLEQYYAGKRMHNRKEKVMDSCSIPNTHMVTQGAATSYSPMMHQLNQNNLFSVEVPALDDATQRLMDENNQMLHQISSNHASYKIQENTDLFCYTRNNITTIQNNMSNMPGIMSQMPPLPVAVNEELLNALLSCHNQGFMFGSPGIHLEQQQPRQDDLL